MKHREAGTPSGSLILRTSERRLRIAHVVNEPFGFESASGVQQVIHCLARAQAEIGEAVAVFSRDDNAVNVLGEGADSTPATPIKVSARCDSSLRERFLSRYLERELAEHVLAWQPDMVHFHSVHIPQNVALAAVLRQVGIPYCVTVHGGLFGAALRRGRIRKRLFRVLFEQSYLNSARFVHAVSPHEFEVIRRYGVGTPIIVVPNGLPPDANIPASRPDTLYRSRRWLRDRRVFMFIGRLDPWQKGLDLLVEAIAPRGIASGRPGYGGPGVCAHLVGDWPHSRIGAASCPNSRSSVLHSTKRERTCSRLPMCLCTPHVGKVYRWQC